MESLVQTIAVLSACLVYVTKAGIDSYKKKKNGVADVEELAVRKQIMDLHDWHKPIPDVETGQPRFMWYHDTVALQVELKANRDTMEQLRACLTKTQECLEALTKALERSNGGA